MVITADTAAETYTVQIGVCDSPLPMQTLISNAQFRDFGTNGDMSHYAVWGSTGVTTDLKMVLWSTGPCNPRTCTDFECGINVDGCGDFTPNCGSCGGGETCAAGICCTLDTCGGAGYECGTPPDGCGGTLSSCGTCTLPLTCDAGFQCSPQSQKPNASNTGHDGNITPYGGSNTITVNGTTLEDFSASYIYINADNVTLRNCEIGSGSTYALQILSGSTNALIEDCEIYTTSSNQNSIVYDQGTGTVIRRSHIHTSSADAIKVASNGMLVEHSYLHDMGLDCVGHIDPFQLTGAPNFIARWNNVESMVACSCQIGSGGGASHTIIETGSPNALFEDNWFAGARSSNVINGADDYATTLNRNKFGTFYRDGGNLCGAGLFTLGTGADANVFECDNSVITSCSQAKPTCGTSCP
jgi:hypothetical protein